MSDTYFIQEAGDDDLGYSWEVFSNDNKGHRLVQICSCMDEKIAERIVSALKWQASLGDGFMGLAQDGIIFDVRTGNIWTPPEKTKGVGIKFEKPKTKS